MLDLLGHVRDLLLPIILRDAGNSESAAKSKFKTSMLGSLLLILVIAGAPIQDGAAVRQSEVDFARGVALQQQGDLQHAREAYEAALRSVPNRADALSNLGVIFARLGQYGEAIKYYKEALAVDEKQHDTRLNLGIAFYKTEEFELAQRELFPGGRRPTG